jgi:hypothetical protein
MDHRHAKVDVIPESGNRHGRRGERARVISLAPQAASCAKLTAVAIEIRCPQCDSIVSVESAPAKVERIDDGTGIRHVVIRDGTGRIVHECN